ncbi:MAG: tetraacyldisaccharide 4'-kinase [Desulfobacterales bacterium]|nr:tetraacyldisaccharide 4'-kinase [Desulfobacterales bacterium]
MAKFRSTLYKNDFFQSRQLPCKLISIGNLTIGGTGKTPMTIYVAKHLKCLGYKVAVISRGYGGKAEILGGIVSDGQKIYMQPETAGDEPFMMAAGLQNIPVIVGKNRFQAGMRAIDEFNPDVIVLDDAFQHYQLARDINLVLLDAARPFGNTCLLPRGTLREPAAALSRADAFILTRCSFESNPGKTLLSKKYSHLFQGKPIFRSRHAPYISRIVPCKTSANQIQFDNSVSFDPKFLNQKKAFAFSGLARNDEFLSTVKDFGCKVEGFLSFPDHHPYSGSDIDQIFEAARRTKVDYLLTTEKDYVRMDSRLKWPVDLMVIGVKIVFYDDKNNFDNFIKNRLSELT